MHAAAESLFDAAGRRAMEERIRAVGDGSPRGWGRMQPAAMFAHCSVGLQVALGDVRLKRALLGLLFGRIAKRTALGTRPLPRNLPTGPEFKVARPRPLEDERAALLALVARFGAGPGAVADGPHPFFGAMTAAEWDRLQWRHLDHHLRQFGA